MAVTEQITNDNCNHVYRFDNDLYKETTCFEDHYYEIIINPNRSKIIAYLTCLSPCARLGLPVRLHCTLTDIVKPSATPAS